MMNMFSPSVLKRESAYVVPALRRPVYSNRDAKLKLILLAGVVVVHILVLLGALFFLPAHAPQAASAQLIPELMLSLESNSAPTADEAQSLPSKGRAAPSSAINPDAQPPLSSVSKQNAQTVKRQSLSSSDEVKSSHEPSSSALTTAASTISSSRSIGSQSGHDVGESLRGNSGNNTDKGALSHAGGGMVSAAVCSALSSFNRRYPGELERSSTVVLNISRNAQGAVTSVGIARSSGNASLDQFAVNSARNARFQANPDCGQRSFALPIVFKPN